MRSIWVAASVLGLSSIAFAQPGGDQTEPTPPPPSPAGMPAPPPPPPPGPTPMPPGQPAPTQVTTVDEGVIQDANSGRSWITPTALTPPAGTWSFSDYELLLAEIGYAVTDQFSLSATVLLPVFEDMPFFGYLSAKMQLVKAGSVRGAVNVNLMHASEDESSLSFGNVGGALTMCIDVGCHSHLTGYLGGGFLLDTEVDQNGVPFIAAVAATFKVARHVKIVLEADTGFIAGDVDEVADGFLGWYGLRFTSKYIGVDLGFAKPFSYEDGAVDTDPFQMGLPWVSFTYRGYND